MYAENERIVDVFRALATQWRVVAGAMGGIVYQGIDYASAIAIMPALGVPKCDRADVFAGLRIMESAAVTVLNKKPDSE